MLIDLLIPLTNAYAVAYNLTVIAKQLAQFMRSNKLTQSAMADQLDVSQPTVSRWLKGEAPRGRHYQRILNLLEPKHR